MTDSGAVAVPARSRSWYGELSPAGKRTFCTLVALLRQANNLVGKTQIKGRCLRGVEVGMGLPPSLKLKYI